MRIEINTHIYMIQIYIIQENKHVIHIHISPCPTPCLHDRVQYLCPCIPITLYRKERSPICSMRHRLLCLKSWIRTCWLCTGSRHEILHNTDAYIMLIMSMLIENCLALYTVNKEHQLAQVFRVWAKYISHPCNHHIAEYDV